MAYWMGNAAEDLYKAWWKKSLFIGMGCAFYVVLFLYLKTWIFSYFWTPVSILMAWVAIASFFNGIFYLAYGVIYPFAKYFKKTFYGLALGGFTYLFWVLFSIKSWVDFLTVHYRFAMWMFDLNIVLTLIMSVDILILCKFVSLFWMRK